MRTQFSNLRLWPAQQVQALEPLSIFFYMALDRTVQFVEFVIQLRGRAYIFCSPQNKHSVSNFSFSIRNYEHYFILIICFTYLLCFPH